jgi:hypothetical protein
VPFVAIGWSAPAASTSMRSSSIPAPRRYAATTLARAAAILRFALAEPVASA